MSATVLDVAAVNRPVPDDYCYQCGKLASGHRDGYYEVCDRAPVPWTVTRAALRYANNVTEVLGLPTNLDDWGPGDQALIRAITERLNAWADISDRTYGVDR
jgi:hypothetical protein